VAEPDAVTIAYVGQNEVAMSWHLSIIQMIAYDSVNSQRLARGGYLVMRCGTDGLAEARNSAVRAFLAEAKADWLFWIDTDMGFEPDIVDRLMAEADPDERPLVGALCFGSTEDEPDGFGGYRTHPTPTTYRWTQAGDQVGWTPFLDFTPGQLLEVHGTGSAAVLIHRSVFERIAVANGPNWYTRELNPTTGQLVSEDLSLCLRMRAQGIPMFVHTGVETTHLKPMWLGSHHYWNARLLENIAKQMDGQEIEVPA